MYLLTITYTDGEVWVTKWSNRDLAECCLANERDSSAFVNGYITRI